MVHGLAGLAHAGINTWPMLLIAGSAEQACLAISSPVSPTFECSLQTPGPSRAVCW